MNYFKPLLFILMAASLFVVSCTKEDTLVQNKSTDISFKLTNSGCTYDLTSQVNFLQSRFGECLSFQPPIPTNNQLYVPCGETIFIQPFDCERPLPIMEFSGDCEECENINVETDPCENIDGNIDIEYEKVKESGDCCFIKITVTNNSIEPIGIYRNGVLLITLEAGESRWIAWAQGADYCFSPPASSPTDVENLFISPVGNPNANCLDISFPECHEL